jgi:Fe-S-cluster-containing dehydrogenase component
MKNGRLQLRAGGRLKKLLTIFSNPKMPSIQDYYEPWTYDYETLLNAPAQKNFPVARPYSLISGKPVNISWSANWDDDLGGSREHAAKDVMLRGIEDKVKFEFEQTFMFYLPRICEHCLNPSCAASCPSGAIYKREEDGIVLVDQDRCRGWRMCITGCPYKKIYFNHKTGKAEKCTFCYPRIEVGIPTVCSETCVGRLRYIGLVLYDADKVLEAATEVVVPVGRPADLHRLARDQRLRLGDGRVLPQRGRDQRVVLVGPRLVVVAQLRQHRVGEDLGQPREPRARAQLELPALEHPAALPAVLVLVGPRVALAGPGLHIVEPHVLHAGAVGPRLLAGHRAGVAPDALVEVHHHAHLGHDLHQYSTSWARRRMTVISSRWLPVGPR